MTHPFHFRVKFLKRDVRRLTKAVVHLVFLFCGGRGAKWSGPPGAREAQIRRRKCEDFASRNEGTRDSGERGAKRGGRRAPEKLKSGGGNVRILLPETKA